MELHHHSWSGWQASGRYLITPQRQKVTAEVLAHLIGMHETRLHFERVGLQAQARAARARQEKRAHQVVKVIVVSLADWKARHLPGAG